MTYRGAEEVDPADSTYQKAEDQWQRQLEREVAIAIGNWLEQNGKLSRPIHALSLEELEAIGIEACGAYVQAREKERQRRLTQNSERPLKLESWEIAG